ncbi:MAG: transglutaminase domain-containing protein, partial [Candidatus Kariarchaeaceae archaeon]
FLTPKPSRFTAVPGSIDSVYGGASLPGGAAQYLSDDTNGFFRSAYDDLIASTDENTTVYNIILKVSNDISSALLQNLDSINIDPTQTSGVAGPNIDKAYYFYEALDDPTIEFGMKELLAGFTNMLRVLGIPARPIIGFSVGDYLDCSTPTNCDSIQIQFKHLHVWIEALIPWEDTDGTHYSWGIFNPIPDPYLLEEDSSDLEFGRNALGGAPEVELEITSGDITSLGGQSVEGEDSFSLNDFGQNLTGRVKVSYDGVAQIGQEVDLRLLNELHLQQGATDVTSDIGFELNDVITTSDGWGYFNVSVHRNRSVYRFNDSTGRYDQFVTSLDPVNPTGTQLGEYNIYALVALALPGYELKLVGWNLNVTINLSLDAFNQSMTNPFNGENITSYKVLQGSPGTTNATIEVDDEEGNPYPQLEGVILYIMDQNDFATLSTLFSNLDVVGIAQFLDTSDQLGTFNQTDVNGNSTLAVSNDVFINYTPGDVYILLAHLDDSANFDTKFLYISNDMTLETNLNLHGQSNQIDTNITRIWHVESNATAFLNDPLIPPEPGTNVNLTYYAIRRNTYITVNSTWSTLDSFLSGSCVDTNSSTSECFHFNPANPNLSFNVTGGAETDSGGLANATIMINNQAFPTGSYYIVVVGHDYGIYVASINYFIIFSLPALRLNSLISGNPPMVIEDAQNMVEEGSDETGSQIITKTGFSVLLTFTALVILSRRFNN